MSKKNRDLESLIDIYNAGSDILAFTDGINKEDLQLDREKRNATLYSIQIVGEATKRLSLEFRQANSHIPWRDIAGMRDKIVHEYNKIDLNIVWEVATQEIPKLLEQIEDFLPQESSSELVDSYELYSKNSDKKGLARAVEIAKNALADGVKRETVVEMLTQNNSAYRDLLAVAGKETTEKIIIQQAEVEGELKPESSTQSSDIKRSPSKRKDS
ncbi:HepT-like ribonuclease domain-containing protein [Myxosarcina sp. GI1(2024)]